MVASKFDEIDYNLVKTQRLSMYFQTVAKSDFVRTEKKLLEFFGWDLKISSPLHFLQTYETCGIALDNEDLPSLQEELRSTFKSATNASNYLSLRGQYLPSQIAAALIFQARVNLNLEQWPQALQVITGYSAASLTPINFIQ